MNPQAGWVQLFSDRMGQEFTQFKVVNASISGETTGGGLVRINQSLNTYQPELVILELGANDGLRGVDPAVTRANLDAMLAALNQARIPVLLAGMLAPPSKELTSAL